LLSRPVVFSSTMTGFFFLPNFIFASCLFPERLRILRYFPLNMYSSIFMCEYQENKRSIYQVDFCA